MTSVQVFRELINERLTVAAEEIFRVFQETISQYEKEIDRQRVLLDIVWKPQIKLHRTELQQQHVCKEEEVPADQQLCDQERNSSLDPENPEPLQIKVEQEEVCTSLEVEQLVLKQETETFMLTPTCEESEAQTLDLSPNEIQSEAEKEHVVSMSVESSVGPEPTSDDQLLSHNSHLAENQVHKRGKHGDSGSTRKAEPKLEKRNHRSKSQTNNENNSTTLHIHSNTYTEEKSFKCDICEKSFSCKSFLRRHMRVHTGEKPYPCKTCEKRFSQLGALKVHTRIHTGERPYPCNICEKRFSELSKVKVHMRIHTGERPYSCNTCGKRFCQLGALNQHMRTHTGEKPYPCNTCGRRFSDMTTAKRHIRAHTGERPYTCNTCEKSFSELCTLKRHMRIHTAEKPYGCTNCGREFRRRHHLKLHMRRHAGGEDPVRFQT